MASVAVDKVSPAEKEQLAVSYAAFILAGQGAAVDADGLNAVLKAANLNASATLINAFAKTLQGKDIKDFYGAVGGGAPAQAAPAQTAKAAPKEAAKPVAPPPPAEEEEDMDMGDLFG